MRLSFEVSPPQDDGRLQIEVYLDREGRDELIKQLSQMNEKDEHFHLFSPSWFSGWNMTEERRLESSSVAAHVKFYLRPDSEPLFEPDSPATEK